jgi:hypothetical protein
MKADDLPDDLNARIGVLTRREVEARLLGPLIAAFSARFGEEVTLEVLREVVTEAARASGESMREAAGSDALAAFAAGWEPWFRGGALETIELERSPERWSFNVTRCRYAELYRALGMTGLGATLSCRRDAALVEGFSDDITLERTQTLMQGASHCDFRYRRRDETLDR